ncbi:juvenile hormone esterase-like [Uranotaenia lowii]|uniref:juvenile hormone esterase-like n=1 Tax=Uranotaenia lowii TaxID=190385 RepID=UPI00247A6392|nr:juvenile hormone esterase-like [Uranotaenia lowii]
MCPTGVLLVVLIGIVRAQNQEDGPLVCIQDGCLRGRYLEGLSSKRYQAFLGIPYAKPPVGELRFRNPQPLDPWTGEYDASFERSICVQKIYYFLNQPIDGSEDCLYINVFRPNQEVENGEKPLPVLVYIHGGGYSEGSSSMGEHGPERLMDSGKVILVLMQYRLGVFGFLSTDDHVAPGNFGLKDQAAVLRWVNRNIDRFGGDPSSVTLMGQSVGAAAVQMHMMSPLSRDLFSRAISFGGNALGFWNKPREDQIGIVREQATAVGIASADQLSSEELVQALRNVTALELCESIEKLKFWHMFPLTQY